MTDACGYQKGGAGTCNSTVFGYPFEPLGNMLADTPKDFKKQTVDVIGTDATAFKDVGYNGTATRAASLLTFVCSLSPPSSNPSLSVELSASLVVPT